MPTLAQVYEDHAADCTRAAEQTDDPVFREMLLTLALQLRLAAREEARRNRSRKRLNAPVEMPARRNLRQRNHVGVRGL
jgi:hypothetical protein